MGQSLPSFAKLLRGTVTAILAVLLLARVGPFCDAAHAALAVSPIAMANCEGGSTEAPQKKSSRPGCSTLCVALPGEALARLKPVSLPSIMPWSSVTPGLADLPLAPGTPPPRIV